MEIFEFLKDINSSGMQSEIIKPLKTKAKTQIVRASECDGCDGCGEGPDCGGSYGDCNSACG